MKAIFIALICISVAYAGIHPYFAESNYICELCKHHSRFLQEENFSSA